MFSLHLASVLVSLLCLSAAAPAPDDCSQLTQPLTRSQLDQILGRWILIEGFSDERVFDSVLENTGSMWIKINLTADNNTLLLEKVNPRRTHGSRVRSPLKQSRQNQVKLRQDQNQSQQDHNQTQQDHNQNQHPVNFAPHHQRGRCLRTLDNVTIIDGQALEVYVEVAFMNLKFLQSCTDCLLMLAYAKEINYQALFLLGRNKTLSASDLETARKQAVCLQFPLPAKFHYDGIRELCPM